MHPGNGRLLDSPTLDSSIAKQMAALNAAGISRIANNRPVPAATNDVYHHNPTPANQKERGFLMGLAGLMTSRNTPLPPQLTGVPAPTYDPATSPWRTLDVAPTDIGRFRLAGKEVELFKLWGAVFQLGGFVKVSQQNAWPSVVKHLDLPEILPAPHNGTTSTLDIVGHYYRMILLPFEDAYKRNVLDQQRKAHALRNPVPTPMATALPHLASPHTPSSAPPPHFPPQPSILPPPPLHIALPTPHTPHIRPASSSINIPFQATPTMPRAPSSDSFIPQNNPFSAQQSPEKNLLDLDAQGIKRKMDSDDIDIKRARQKTDPLHSAASDPPPFPPKIEYVPLARQVDTYGGRDLAALDDVLRAAQRRPVRDINDWGAVDIEALTMSVRSRLAAELSYALTTLTLLSTMRGQTPGSGFPIFQCPELLDEMLDLLEDEAFQDDHDNDESEPKRIVTHRELQSRIQDEETLPFAGLEPRQGRKSLALGPKQRPANTVLAIVNILRNLSVVQDNLQFLAQQDRMTDILLRTCGVAVDASGAFLRPAAGALSTSDLTTVRKDVLHIFSNIAPMIQLAAASEPVLRRARRMFALTASFLVDPAEAVSPFACVKQAGTLSHSPKPPALPDIALEVFTRFAQPDPNRFVFSKAVSQDWLWCLLQALVHRLPVADIDYSLLAREQWLGYLEKLMMAIYCLAFLAPPPLKAKIKTDRTLRAPHVLARVVQKALAGPSADARAWFLIAARRAVEALKLVDDGADAFADPARARAAPPAPAFGMGWGEAGARGPERGTGVLGGRQELAWEVLVQREVDDVMFAELESLVRVEAID